MKKNIFYAACLMAGAMGMFSSCSNDGDITVNGSYNGGADKLTQTINIAVANSGDNFLSTRANRPLYSTEAKQDINTVKVLIYKDEEPVDGKYTIVAEKTFTDWMNGGVSTSFDNANGHGRMASWSLSGDKVLPEGNYVAYAVGYNKVNTAFDYTGLSDFEALTGSAKTPGTGKFPLTVEEITANGVREIFAGSQKFTVEEKTVTVGEDENPKTVTTLQLNTTLTLHRQVAGVLGYFTNIPAKGNADNANVEAKKLRLVASSRSTKAVFSYFNSDFKAEDKENHSTTWNIVNGYNKPAFDAVFFSENNTKADAYKVYEVDLTQWFKPVTIGGEESTTTTLDQNGDGLLNADDTNWQFVTKGEARVRKGSVLAGKFVIPFEKVADKASLQLQLLGDKDKIIRIWNIRLPESSQEVIVLNEDGEAPMKDGNVVKVKENNVNYSLLRNHVYSLGMRNANDNPGGGDPDKPIDPEDPENPEDPDDDKPQDLNNENLILRVNDNWEAIHEMVID